MTDKEPTYCTADDVAETLDLPDPNDSYGTLMFSDLSHPSIRQVNKMILANEDVIDRRLKRSWRTNYVFKHILNIPKYWQDENAWRMEYYRQGGNYIQLRKDILPWDPNPVYSEEEVQTTVPLMGGIYDQKERSAYVADVTGMAVGSDASINGETGKITFIANAPEYNLGSDIHGKWRVKYYKRLLSVGARGKSGQVDGKVTEITANADGTYDITWNPIEYEGDKLEVRTNSNLWLDMSDKCIDGDASYTSEDMPYSNLESLYAADAQNNTFWFDRPNGRLFLKRRVYMPAAQGLRITYRWGTPDDEVPAAINRLACLLTASQVINMQIFNVRLGAGGDINGVREALVNSWNNEASSIWASYQRPGAVYSLLR